MKKSSVLLSLTSFLLAAAIGLVAYGSTQIPAPKFKGHLKDILPPAPEGWIMKDRPIAETPEMKQAVGELLNFDDGVFVDYINTAGDRLSVYIAYWTPGKMSHRLVAGHTPDICWVGAGWEKKYEGVTPNLEVRSSVSNKHDSTLIPVGENRIYSAQNTIEYVWFWHIVGNEVMSYKTGGNPPWHSIITDTLKKGINQREEQFFIRLSSNRQLTPSNSTVPMNSLLRSIPWPISK
jgi:Protein of unknown function (DUF3485)